jgi:hypothetical protein
MILQEVKRLKTGKRELRNFGLLVGGVFLGLALWFWWRQKPYYILFAGAGAPLVLLGAVFPGSLRLMYLAWMAMAVTLGLIMTTILLTLFFYLVVTPIGLLARLAGKDFLQRRRDPKSASYWMERESKAIDTVSYEQQY